MAYATLRPIDAPTGATTRLECLQSPGPRRVTCINVDDTRCRVDSGATPLTTTIKTRKDDGATSELKGRKLSVTAHLFELVHCPGMHLGGAVGQQIFCESLPGKWFDPSR